MMEKHVQRYLLDRVESESLISKDQWGFLNGRSTTGALVTIVDKWHRCLGRGSDVCAVFLDLKKAFDTVPHRPLLNLLNELGINPFVLHWLESFLLDRWQTVVVGGMSSDAVGVLSGVPQGSVLGPLLFLLYINSVIEVVTDVSVFADDILLYFEITEIDDYASVQENIDLTLDWSTRYHMDFNVDKCKHMIVSRKRAPIRPSDGLHMAGACLEEVSKYRYLGV